MCIQLISKREHSCKQELVEIWRAPCVPIVVTNSMEKYRYVCVSGAVVYYGFLECDAASLGELFLTFRGNIGPCELTCQTVH
jgi:hypothetical protein